MEKGFGVWQGGGVSEISWSCFLWMAAIGLLGSLVFVMKVTYDGFILIENV